MFLKELSEFRLSDPEIAARVPKQKVRESWLGEPLANEQQIAALEGPLRRALPPSHRSFPAAPNGFEQQSPFIYRLNGDDEADRFSVRNPEEAKRWAEAYRNTYPGLASWLQISEIGDCAVVLLDLDEVSPDGEWPAYFFARWGQTGIDMEAFESIWRKA